MSSTGKGGRSLNEWLRDPGKIGRRTLLVVLVMSVPVILLAALGGTLWGPKGSAVLLRDPVFYVRVLVAVPILMFAEPRVGRILAAINRSFQGSPLLDERNHGQYQQVVASFERSCRSRRKDIVLLVLAVVVVIVLLGSKVTEAETWYSTGGGLSAAGAWYFLVVVVPFELLIFRWIHGYLLWCVLLVRFARLPLRLNPIHPDCVGGLAPLGIGHMGFSVLFFVGGALFSALLCEDILLGQATLASVKTEVAGYVLFSILALLAPLTVLTPTMYRARLRGLLDQGSMATVLFDAFGEKWVPVGRTNQAKLLGNQDPSSLADFGYCYEVARGMNLMPISLWRIAASAAILAAPFAPLLLTEYPVSAILSRVVDLLG